MSKKLFVMFLILVLAALWVAVYAENVTKSVKPFGSTGYRRNYITDTTSTKHVEVDTVYSDTVKIDDALTNLGFIYYLTSWTPPDSVKDTMRFIVQAFSLARDTITGYSVNRLLSTDTLMDGRAATSTARDSVMRDSLSTANRRAVYDYIYFRTIIKDTIAAGGQNDTGVHEAFYFITQRKNGL